MYRRLTADAKLKENLRLIMVDYGCCEWHNLHDWLLCLLRSDAREHVSQSTVLATRVRVVYRASVAHNSDGDYGKNGLTD